MHPRMYHGKIPHPPHHPRGITHKRKFKQNSVMQSIGLNNTSFINSHVEVNVCCKMGCIHSHTDTHITHGSAPVEVDQENRRLIETEEISQANTGTQSAAPMQKILISTATKVHTLKD